MGKKIANKIKNNFNYYSQGLYIGRYHEYDISIRYDAASILYNMYFHINGMKDASKLNKLLYELDKHCVAKYKNNELTITQACDSIKDMPRLVNKTIKVVVEYLEKNKYKNICIKCGKANNTSLYDYDGNKVFYCDDCYNSIIEDNIKQKKHNKQMKENVILGIIGSIIGCLPGLIIFIVLAYLNINSTLAALIIMLGSAYGYKWFSRCMKTTGLIISLIIGLMFTILANDLNNAYILYNEYSNLYNINLLDAYKAIPYYVNNSISFRETYIESLLITLLFAAFGSLSNFGLYRKYIVVNKIKKVGVTNEKN